MSCTSPYTVASTTVPFVYPSAFSRNCSRCFTAFFITSALCSTNGRISSPEPNLSPTSFIAGSSTSFSTRTGSARTPAASSASSIPSFLRCSTIQCTRSCGAMPAVGSAFSPAPPPSAPGARFSKYSM